MKLPRLRRKPIPQTGESASISPAAPVLQVLIYSNTDLPEQEFRAQTEKLRRVASYDNASRSWYGQIPFDRPEWAAEMLTALFDTARLHGTDIRVQTQPASEDSPSGEELCVAGTSAPPPAPPSVSVHLSAVPWTDEAASCKYRNLAEPGPERQNGQVYSADFLVGGAATRTVAQRGLLADGEG